MKKFSKLIALLLALTLIFSLAACGNKTDGDSDKKESSSDSKKEEENKKENDATAENQVVIWTTATEYDIDEEEVICKHECKIDAASRTITVTSTYYDEDGNKQDSNETEFEFNVAGELIRLNGEKYEYSYDAAGNVVRKTEDTAGVKSETIYEYDAAGNLTCEIYYNAAGQKICETRYDAAGNETHLLYYNEEGNLTSENKSVYEYNADGYVVRKTTSLGTEYERTFKYVYDDANNVIRIDDYWGDLPGGSCEYEYDSDGNMIRAISKMVRYYTTRYKDYQTVPFAIKDASLFKDWTFPNHL